MQQLTEFYEMLSLNAAALCATEKRGLSEARLALLGFEKAMQDIKMGLRAVQLAAPALPQCRAAVFAEA